MPRGKIPGWEVRDPRSRLHYVPHRRSPSTPPCKTLKKTQPATQQVGGSIHQWEFVRPNFDRSWIKSRVTHRRAPSYLSASMRIARSAFTGLQFASLLLSEYNAWNPSLAMTRCSLGEITKGKISYPSKLETRSKVLPLNTVYCRHPSMQRLPLICMLIA